MSANTNLFNQTFIDFVQSIMFAHNDKFHDEEYILGCMPEFYKHSAMISGALNILAMSGKIEHKTIEGKNTYKAIPRAIEEVRNDEIVKRSIVSLTEKNLRLQNKDLQTKIFWAFIGIAFGVISSNLKEFLSLIKRIFQ
jgi:hypothetical protein